ncbi:MAG: methyltransferase [Clostridiaceae bacterium]|nr:methyltransferase [Eubacteriales bacterium]
MELYAHEVVEDLLFNGLKIIRDTRGFTYGTDAVLLANFARAKESERVLDLGAGTGILSILINGKTGARVTAVELDENMCDMLRRSARMNGQQDFIRVVCADLRDPKLDLAAGGFDVAVCNPPYHASGTRSQNNQKRVSTHQDECTVYDVADSAARLLKNGGRLYLVYPVSRLAEAFYALKLNRLEPKRAQMVFTRRGAPPHVALIEAKKAGRTGMLWETPAFLWKEK